MQFRINPNTIINNYNKDKTVQTSEEKINIQEKHQTNRKGKNGQKKMNDMISKNNPIF